jgi:hypothetical protein
MPGWRAANGRAGFPPLRLAAAAAGGGRAALAETHSMPRAIDVVLGLP